MAADFQNPDDPRPRSDADARPQLDGESFGRLIRDKVRQFLGPKCRTPDTAFDPMDLMQEVAVAVVQKFHLYDPAKGSVWTFISRITASVLLDIHRRVTAAKRNPNRDPFVERDLGQLSPDDCVDDRKKSPFQSGQRDLQIDLDQLIAALPPDLQQTARDLLLNSPLELAQKRGVHHSAVYRQIHAIRARWEGGTLGDYRD